MNKVFVFLADGFEEIEGLTVVDMLRRAGIEVIMVSVGPSKMITGSHHIEVEAEGAMYVLPGGMPGTIALREHEGLAKLLKKAYDNGKYLAAICAAPTVLGKYGFLDGKKATCYPGQEDGLGNAEYVTESVVAAGKVITSRGMGTAIPFAGKLVELLLGTEAKEKVLESIIYEEK